MSKVTAPPYSTLVLGDWEGSGIQTSRGLREAVCVKGVAVWGNGSSLDTKSLSLVTGFSYFGLYFRLGRGAGLHGQDLCGNGIAVRISQLRVDGLGVLKCNWIHEMNQVVT